MSITVKEALTLDSCKRFRLVAGQAGLDNRIRKVGILDYEMDELLHENFLPGEFIITTLLNIKDDLTKLYTIVEALISIGVSGLAIKNIYFQSIPGAVIGLANQHNFPIFLFEETYFEHIINGVMLAIKKKESNRELVNKIDGLINRDLSKREIRTRAYEINQDFREENIVAFIKRSGRETGYSLRPSELGVNKQSKIIPYQNGYLYLMTDRQSNTAAMKDRIRSRLRQAGFNEDYTIGISSLHHQLEDLTYSLKESIYAFEYGRAYNRQLTFFAETGTSMILLPLLSSPWIQRYYHEYITPLEQYDRRNGTELLETAVEYIENNGDIKSTAEDLIQHSNTVRYRLNKISEILNAEGAITSFYEELALAMRIFKLKNG